MNKKIKELISQSYEYAVVTTIDPFTQEVVTDYIDGTKPIFNKEKFAELIVEECRTVVNDLYHKTPLELCGPLLTADEEIAKHFYGVEE